MMEALYPTLVWLHVLLFVVWLGADLGVFILGQHFRRKQSYSVPERLILLKLLVITDMGPRTAWALMVPSSLTLLKLGPWWPTMPGWLLWAGFALGALWLWLVWDAHTHDQTPRAARAQKNEARAARAQKNEARAARARSIENPLKFLLTGFYLTLGIVSLRNDTPLEPFIAWKALLFGCIFVAAILIDTAFKPLGPQLMKLIAKGSSDQTEIPLRTTMDRTRIWVMLVYLLLLVTSWLGVTKGVPLL